MSFDVNADEIFQIGVRVEINRQRFYERVAKNTSDPSVKKISSDLSRWGSEHIEPFEKLRTE
jgi:rubrerythrin